MIHNFLGSAKGLGPGLERLALGVAAFVQGQAAGSVALADLGFVLIALGEGLCHIILYDIL